MLCKIASRGPMAVPRMLSLHQRQPPNPMKQAYQASEIHLGHFSHSHGQGSSFHDHFITLVYLNPQLYCTMLIQGFSSSVPSLPSPPRTAAFWVSPPRLGGEQLLFNSKANLARVSSTCLRWPSGSKLKGQNHVGRNAREEGQGRVFLVWWQILVTRGVLGPIRLLWLEMKALATAPALEVF